MATLAKGDSRREGKKLASARSVAGPSVDVVAYGSGIGHSRATAALVLLGLGYGAVLLTLLVVVGRFLLPGVLLLLAAYYLVRPLRGVAVTQVGILVMQEGMMNERPARVLYLAPPDALGPFDEHLEGTRHVRVQIGPELIRMRRSVYESLVLAVQDLAAADGSDVTPGGIPPGWYHDPLGRYQFRYWDEGAWTTHVSHNGMVCVDPVA